MARRLIISNAHFDAVCAVLQERLDNAVSWEKMAAERESGAARARERQQHLSHLLTIMNRAEVVPDTPVVIHVGDTEYEPGKGPL